MRSIFRSVTLMIPVCCPRARGSLFTQHTACASSAPGQQLLTSGARLRMPQTRAFDELVHIASAQGARASITLASLKVAGTMRQAFDRGRTRDR